MKISPAGAGKSVLAASVIDCLENALQDGEVLVFFYCDFRNERSTSASEVMRSLLSQLLQQLDRHMVDPGGLVDELIKQRDEGASTISNATRLARRVSCAAKQFIQQPFVVIDALDECKNIEELLDALTELNKGSVRLFVTSRPLQIIKESYSGLPSISMDMMKYAVSTDIRLHVTRELDSHRRLRIVHTSLKKEINSALCEKADGMFRWVQCQLSVLKRCVTTVRIREALNNLPHDLNETYERILLGINKDEERGVVRRALEWLVASLEPLQLSQIMESLSIDLGRRILDFESRPVHGPALLDTLGSLVIYDELTDVVILSHFSVKEYLVGDSARIKHPAYHINEQLAHTQLALLCMCYIAAYIKCGQQSSGYGGLPRDSYTTTMRRGDSDVIPSHATSESHPLLDYVQTLGFYHLRFINLGSRVVVLRALETLQGEVQQYPSDWEQLCERSYSFYPPWPTLKHDLALYILTAYALEPLLRSYIGRSKLKLKDGTNPLIYAAHFGKAEHARTLLSSGVNLNRRGWSVGPDPHQVLPLEVAVVHKLNNPTVDLFLKEGSPVAGKLFANALEKRFSSFSASIVARLLQTDQFAEWAVDIDEGHLLRALSPSRYSGYPPFHAVHQDIVEMQRRLAQIGCDTSSAFNETYLRHAVSAGHISTVKLILALNIPMPPDIILDASQNGSSNSEMIHLFLSRGCDVDVVSPDGDTALHFIVKSRLPEDDCLQSVQVLIDAGCNPSTANLVGETALHLAASLGYVSV
ncbi:ankyrin, partial [Imleria badia]